MSSPHDNLITNPRLSVTPAPSPVVRVVPLQPHCFAFGGFELQMINAMNASRTAGIDISPLDPWRRQDDFDLLHLWGLDLQHEQTIRWARLSGKKTILSVLVKYPGWQNRFRFAVSWLLGPWRMKARMLTQVDAVTVVNQQQAEYLCSIVGYPRERIFVVPNVVEDIFFAPPHSVAGFNLDIDNYVLSTGNICQRKNQLSLVRACRSLGVPLLLVGNPLPGEENYARAVSEEISGDPRMRWLRGLPAGSPELAMVYDQAALFALVSLEETQPISALEAAAAGKPLLLTNRPFAKQEYYNGAVLVDPVSVTEIYIGIKRALEQPQNHTPPRHAIEQCRFSVVGKTYADIYQITTKPQLNSPIG